MKELIFVSYDAKTGETSFRFADEFSDLTRQEQLEIAEATQERIQALIVNLQALIRRSSSNNS
jgi:hypothetical protein